jgi:hypothetical protein
MQKSKRWNNDIKLKTVQENLIRKCDNFMLRRFPNDMKMWYISLQFQNLDYKMISTCFTYKYVSHFNFDI